MEHPKVRTGCFFGGIPLHEDIETLISDQTPHIIVGTPGRLKALTERGFINVQNVYRSRFIDPIPRD
jgi:superfamily II DNA/RNA helicase